MMPSDTATWLNASAIPALNQRSKKMEKLTIEAFDSSRAFVYRHGRLIDRKRFSYHFEGGSKRDVMDVLACYQNEDGGFGHGLEPDIMCPASSAIASEMATRYLDELEVSDGALVDRLEKWILSSQETDGTRMYPDPSAHARAHHRREVISPLLVI